MDPVVFGMSRREGLLGRQFFFSTQVSDYSLSGA
jgi:hypothetical protein